MKLLITSVLCLLFSPSLNIDVLLNTRKQARNEATYISPKIALYPKIVRKSYCRSTNKTKDILRLSLLLTYKNITSTESIILYKHSNSVLQVLVAKELVDIQKQAYEYQALLTTVTDGKKLHFDEPFPNKYFSILLPGMTVQTHTDVWVEVARDATSKDSALKAGDHYLQLQMSTWEEADISLEQLKVRWKEQGTLWAFPLESKPLKFNINQTRVVQPSCNP